VFVSNLLKLRTLSTPAHLWQCNDWNEKGQGESRLRGHYRSGEFQSGLSMHGYSGDIIHQLPVFLVAPFDLPAGNGMIEAAQAA